MPADAHFPQRPSLDARVPSLDQIAANKSVSLLEEIMATSLNQPGTPVYREVRRGLDAFMAFALKDGIDLQADTSAVDLLIAEVRLGKARRGARRQPDRRAAGHAQSRRVHHAPLSYRAARRERPRRRRRGDRRGYPQRHLLAGRALSARIGDREVMR